MRILICNDARHADALSRDLLKTWRGRDNRPGEITTHLFEVIVHPVNGEVALKLPGGFARPVSKLWERIEDMPTTELSKVAKSDTQMRAEITKGKVSSDAVVAIATNARILSDAEAQSGGWFVHADQTPT